MVSVLSRLLSFAARPTAPHLLTCTRALSRTNKRIPKTRTAPVKSIKGSTPKAQLTEQQLQEVLPNLWKQMAKQCIFTSAFVYLVYLTGLFNEITEEQYPEELEYYRFPGDVYDDIWSRVGNFFSIRDTFFNRRVVQICAFTCTCFILSMPLIRRHGRFLSSLGSHPTSSAVSPITSLFLHGSLSHLAANMLGLYVFTIGWHSRGPPIHGSLDNMTHQHLLAFLLAAGAATSILCCVRSAAMKFAPVSIGFSGSLSALIMYEITQKPERRVGFIFAPERYNVSAQQAGWLVVGFELLLMAFGRFHRMDNFGHLVGLGVGYWYSKSGYKFWEYEKKNIEDVYESL